MDIEHDRPRAARKGKPRGPLSEATKQRIGEATKGRKFTEDHKRHLSEALKGKKHTAATKQKISEALKGKKHSPERGEHLSKLFKGQPAAWVRERMPEDERKRRAQANNRRCTLRARYGLSLDNYNNLLAQQEGVCRICRKVCSSGKRLAVDHDHVTGTVRGLLCRRCNRGLGHFHTLETLRRALAYMELHASPQEQPLAIGEARIFATTSP